MQTERLTESKPSDLTLTQEQAALLGMMGRTLASDRTWWGNTVDPSPTTHSVIQCDPVGKNRYRVLVRDAIGAIGLGDTQLIVEPKIPRHHLIYLLKLSGRLPRGSQERTATNEQSAFSDLIVGWFITETERLLRIGLDRGYERAIGDLSYARGRIHSLTTARSILAGRPSIRCEFDTFTEDTPINRVLRAAALRVLARTGLPPVHRRRIQAIGRRLDGAGHLRAYDTTVPPDSRTRHYRDAHQLALMLLSGSGIYATHGEHRTWTFLYRTPEAVEDGVRASLDQHLQPQWPVTKRGRKLRGSHHRTLNPDLVFGDGAAVGDVKYQLAATGDISRYNLNQVTTFATGYGVPKAVVIAFSPLLLGEHVTVGGVDVSAVNWVTTETHAEAAAIALAQQVSLWLSN